MTTDYEFLAPTSCICMYKNIRVWRLWAPRWPWARVPCTRCTPHCYAIPAFRRELKSVLFRLSFPAACTVLHTVTDYSMNCCYVPAAYKLTYLLYGGPAASMRQRHLNQTHCYYYYYYLIMSAYSCQQKASWISRCYYIELHG